LGREAADAWEGAEVATGRVGREAAGGGRRKGGRFAFLVCVWLLEIRYFASCM
jgi:hypothetical protein